MNLFRYLIRQEKLFQRLATLIRETIRLNDYVDTSAAEKSIRNNIYFRGPNAWILAIATIIASVGLNVNSTAVVIGAMLVSPLMGPIFGLGLGLGLEVWKLQIIGRYNWNFGNLIKSVDTVENGNALDKYKMLKGGNFGGLSLSVAYFF